jgi:hypothetical protein
MQTETRRSLGPNVSSEKREGSKIHLAHFPAGPAVNSSSRTLQAFEFLAVLRPH